MVEIRKVAINGRVTIPKKMRRKLNIKKGDMVKISIKNKQIVLEKLTI